MGKTIIVVAGVLLLSLGVESAHAQADGDLPGLIEQLRNNDPATRLNAVESIATMSDQAVDAIPALTELYLGDTDENVRRRARTVLGQIKLAARVKHSVAPPAEAQKPSVASPAAPEIPQGRMAELVRQLKADPAASVTASEELGRMGAEAKVASAALVEVMMRGDEPWHEARLAATEALEKVHPKLQQLLLPSILKLHAGSPPPSLGLSELGTDGRGALPLLLHLWSLDWHLGLHEEGGLLQDMHAVAPTDKRITDIVVGVVRLKETVGINCYHTALEIVGKRNLPADELAELYLGVLGNSEIEALFRLPAASFRIGCLQRLRTMVTSKQIKSETVVKPFIKCLADKDFELRKNALNALGEFGTDAKEAVPTIRRLKLEDPDENIRSAAAAALSAIAG